MTISGEHDDNEPYNFVEVVAMKKAGSRSGLDNNIRDDSSGRFGHSLHHLSWRYHTYHGIAR
jgi:hypothetical protein